MVKFFENKFFLITYCYFPFMNSFFYINFQKTPVLQKRDLNFNGISMGWKENIRELRYVYIFIEI